MSEKSKKILRKEHIRKIKTLESGENKNDKKRRSVTVENITEKNE